MYGAMVVDETGEGLFTTGLRHGDSLHVGDIDQRSVLSPHSAHTRIRTDEG